MTEVVLSESELAERLREMLDKVAAGETEVAVTRDGQIVARVAPARHYDLSIFGDMKVTARQTGDIVDFSTADEWDVDSDNAEADQAGAKLASVPSYGHPLIGGMRGRGKILGDIVNSSPEDEENLPPRADENDAS